MTLLIQILLAQLEVLKPAPGTPSQELLDLLRVLAAFVILDDASQAQIPPGDFDPLIVEAIHAGAAQAAALSAAGSILSLKFEQLPSTQAPDGPTVQTSEVLGPFIAQPGGLLRVLSFQTSAFLSVNRLNPGAGQSGEMWLLIPAGSTADTPDLRSWTLPAGTVWIRSRFLVAGAPDIVGLRIAGGTLRFDQPVLQQGTKVLLVPAAAVWTLSVEPEQPAPGDPQGSDADALNLLMPAMLEVHSNAPPVLTGNVVLSGFGSDLNLTPSGAAFLDGNQVSFPLQAAETQWSIAANRSRVTQFSGESEPVNSRWAIPITRIPPTGFLGEAAHAGSIITSFSKGLTSTLAAQEGGPCRWFAATLTANAGRVHIQSLQADSAAFYHLGLWETSHSELRFAGQPISRLIFVSERGGFDYVGVMGGTCSNRWDLPRRADGKPFDFDGAMSVFTLVATPSSFFTLLRATAPASAELAGIALENLYAIVRPTRNVVLVAGFDTAPLLPSGSTTLIFDVDQIIPTLPDPYADNRNEFGQGHLVEAALRVVLQWTEARKPALSVLLDKPVTVSEGEFFVLHDADEGAVSGAFRTHLLAHFESVSLLDMSSREHLFGVGFETSSQTPFDNVKIIDNRLSVQLSKIRLLMQPQVQWEPVQVVKNPNVLGLEDDVVQSTLNGGLTLVGANSVKFVPILPGSLSEEINGAIRDSKHAAALFSLPFGLRAMTRLDFVKAIPKEPPSQPATDSAFFELPFGEFTSARQLRMVARKLGLGGDNPSRVMPGLMRQLANLKQPNKSGLDSVLPNELRGPINTQFATGVPLHDAALSGYGLSTFSEWSQDAEGPNFSKVEFRVINGRTAYEVIQFRSILYECGARCVRTVILERHNSGRVLRIDTGWVALEPGLFLLPTPFEKGAVRSFKNIRRIRIVGAVFDLEVGASVQPVIFDADADIDGAIGGPVPIYDRPGYIQLFPPPNPFKLPTLPLSPFQLKRLFEVVHAIGSPVDCAVLIGKTLQAQISSIVSDFAPGDNPNDLGFAVAVVGAPKLPRAGQWTVVRIDPATHATSPVDPRRGVPLVCKGAGPFRFREPADTRRKSALIEYALLMATDSCRALFRQPSINPGDPGKMSFDIPPLLADPYSLVQSTGAFPRPNFALPLKEIPSFQISSENLWRMDRTKFTIATDPLTEFMKGGGWGITRKYEPDEFLAKDILFNIDSGATAAFGIKVPPSVLNLELPAPLGEIFKIRTKYQIVDGGLPKLIKPDLLFQGALSELKEILDSLAHMLGLDVPFDISVTAGEGASPSFVVHMHLEFGIGDGPDGRVDIGMGKFSGQFLVRGELEATLKGVERALLFLQFQGDVQQGILPPLLYGGGFFRFSIELTEKGAPVIQLTFAVVISIGGDLIPGLLAVEGTFRYGYSLIPETLAPGVFLGIEARAKLLGGLIGFSFSVEAMAQIKRLAGGQVVTISAQIHVAATVHVAIFLDEDVDFEVQFKQDIPLATLGLLPGVGLLVAPALIPL